MPLPGAGRSRAPRYPDVSAFTGGRPDDAASPGTATPPPLTRRAERPAPAARPTGTTAHRAPGPPERRAEPTPGRRRRPEGPTTGPAALRGRVAVAAVAVGALATGGHSLVDLASDPATTQLAAGSLTLASADATPTAEPTETALRAGDGADAATSSVMAVPAASKRGGGSTAGASGQVSSLAKGRQKAQDAAAAVEAARAPKFIKPAQGTFTSGFGSRWGSTHKGVDIAGPIGTPIVSVADGVVTAAGPASGFGQWVKVRLDDGTETVYGHVNRFFVSEGDHVKAGQEIAEIGNRGQSTGPHLHFEVHTPGGTKINPLPWLTEHGISLGAQKD